MTAVAERTGLRKLRADYRRWHQLQVRTGDIDPVYPVLRHLIAPHLPTVQGQDRAAWLVLLHVTYYHLGSALRAFSIRPDPAPPSPDLLTLPCATERRGHRNPDRLRAHWLALLGACHAIGGPYALLTDLDADTAADRWAQLNDRLTGIHGNGRWAAYKTAELAQKVLGAPVIVADAGHAHSTGPRKGLDVLHPGLPVGSSPAVVARLDRLTAALADSLGEPDIGQVETSLCDFHSLTRGGYYLGHDIDAMLGQLRAVPSDLAWGAYAARRVTLPPEYLGEVGGWDGVDPDRKHAYERTGLIVERP